VLESIYTEIDRLEKSDFPRTRMDRGRDVFPFLLAAAAATLVFETLLSATWLRRTP
jgi:hypothetical protein